MPLGKLMFFAYVKLLKNQILVEKKKRQVIDEYTYM